MASSFRWTDRQREKRKRKTGRATFSSLSLSFSSLFLSFSLFLSLFFFLSLLSRKTYLLPICSADLHVRTYMMRAFRKKGGGIEMKTEAINIWSFFLSFFLLSFFLSLSPSLSLALSLFLSLSLFFSFFLSLFRAYYDASVKEREEKMSRSLPMRLTLSPNTHEEERTIEGIFWSCEPASENQS